MIFLAILLSYICGAIPFGVLVGRACGVDVRASGSGNIGTTNVWRVLGPRAGSLVFALDVAKGFLAPTLGRLLCDGQANAIALCALVAVLGHTFSIFLKGGGGKGIATAFGTMLGMAPLLALGCFAFWGVVLLLSRIISVASIAVCVAGLPAFALTHQPRPYVMVVALFAVVTLLKHVPNMKRLRAGTEPKIGAKKANVGHMSTHVADKSVVQ